MKKIAIIFHSAKGHTRELARAVYLGASNVASVHCAMVEIMSGNENSRAVLMEADAIIFGSPTYMGTVSATFKQFMDLSGDFWLEQPWKNKIAAGFTSATSPSGDKLGTLSALMLFAMQHGMIWVGQEQLGSIHTGDGLGLNEAGSWLGLMAQSNPDKSKMIFEGDRRTAILFGERIATLTARFACNQT